MTTDWIFVSYVAAVIAAVAVLAIFRASSWYLHVTGVALGLVAGLMPPVGASGSAFYLIAGSTFLFFTTWGVGGLFVRRQKRGIQDRVTSSAVPRANRLGRAAASPDGTQALRQETHTNQGCLP